MKLFFNKNYEKFVQITSVTFRNYATIFAETDPNGILAKASRAKRSESSRVYHRRVRAYVRACV